MAASFAASYHLATPLTIARMPPRSGEALLRPPSPIRLAWWTIAMPCVIALAGPVVANGLPGPGATFAAARYRVRRAIAGIGNV
jgi:hypothetical protein